MKKISIVIITTLAFVSCAFSQTRELFNGTDLSGWNLFLDPSSDANPADVFQAKDGVINISGKPFGYMYTKEKFENFRLHIEWRWPETPSNSGIFIFTQEPAYWANCIEVQLRAGSAGDFVLMGGADMKEFKLPENKERPKFPILAKFTKSNENPAGEWNNATITAKNGVIEVFINGTLQNRGTSLNKNGHISLQSEGGPIQFRNIRLTPLN